MAVLHDHAPRSLPELAVAWTERDVILYALGVGAGQSDPGQELDLTTEDGIGPPLRVIPGFAAALMYPALESALSDVDWTDVLYAEQALRLSGALPLAASAHVQAAVEAVHDQGSGALVTVTAVLVGSDDVLLASSRASMFVRGAGGFGGPRAPSVPWSPPDRRPDTTLVAPTRPDQALLYRLVGDRNPLHADPEFAARAGFRTPILHGLCTYGAAVRLLMNASGDTDPASIESVAGRFTAPVVPGETLRVETWTDPGTITFVVRGEDGRVVLDRGELGLR